MQATQPFGGWFIMPEFRFQETEFERTVTRIEFRILPLIEKIDNNPVYDECLEIIEEELRNSHLSLEEKEDVVLYFDEEYGLVPTLWNEDDDV